MRYMVLAMFVLVGFTTAGEAQSARAVAVPEIVSNGERQIPLPGVPGVKLHACPKGYAMAGVVFGQNTFLCRWVGKASSVIFANGQGAGEQRFDMLSCPSDYYMVGLHVERNTAYCARQTSKSAERNAGPTAGVSYSKAGVSFAACPSGEGTGLALGYRADRRQIACGEFGRRRQ